MPVFRHQGALHYYAHIPKCAGSSIEEHLTARFGPLGLFGSHPLMPVSLQHLTWRDIEALFAPGQIASSFAVVRHPVSRFVSSFNMRLAQVDPPFPRELTLLDFAQWAAARLKHNPQILDNHLRPQIDFIGPETRLFRLEDGLDAVIADLDDRFGPQIDAANLGRERHRPDETAALFESEDAVPQSVIDILLRLYEADFDRLGYEPLPAPPQEILRLKPVHARPIRRHLWRARAALAPLRRRS